MVRQRAGAIVHTTSIQRRFPLRATVPYAATKAALAILPRINRTEEGTEA
jgi:NAD(P)-dependent dehydrogenase (short-subunit alcohol dehydrogenase family)